jgi:hypothetical protein
MAHLVESAKSLNVKVKQLARPIPLITTRRRRRIDPAQAMESFSPADPPDGRQAHSGEHCDPPFGHSRSSQRND